MKYLFTCSGILVCSKLRLMETVEGVSVNIASQVPPHSTLHKVTVDQSWHISHFLLTSLAGLSPVFYVIPKSKRVLEITSAVWELNDIPKSQNFMIVILYDYCF
jgi:hypothetical protein